MATQAGENVCVCAVRGNFDDAQTGVKKIFFAVSKDQLLEGKGVRLSSAKMCIRDSFGADQVFRMLC